jgi:hypothetical protein
MSSRNRLQGSRAGTSGISRVPNAPVSCAANHPSPGGEGCFWMGHSSCHQLPRPLWAAVSLWDEVRQQQLFSMLP